MINQGMVSFFLCVFVLWVVPTPLVKYYFYHLRVTASKWSELCLFIYLFYNGFDFGETNISLN